VLESFCCAPTVAGEVEQACEGSRSLYPLDARLPNAVFSTVPVRCGHDLVPRDRRALSPHILVDPFSDCLVGQASGSRKAGACEFNMDGTGNGSWRPPEHGARESDIQRVLQKDHRYALVEQGNAPGYSKNLEWCHRLIMQRVLINVAVEDASCPRWRNLVLIVIFHPRMFLCDDIPSHEFISCTHRSLLRRSSFDLFMFSLSLYSVLHSFCFYIYLDHLLNSISVRGVLYSPRR
jgi:hypothetical protein